MAKKEKEVLDVESGAIADDNHSEPRVYELGFHIDPELSVEEAKKVYQALRAKMEETGSIVAEGEPQKIPLAYTVSRSETGGRRDFDNSYFAWIAYEADGPSHSGITHMAGEENRIFRFIDLRTTKEEAQHSAEMQEMLAKVAPEDGGEPEVSDAEIDAALKEVGV